ncbi:MAG: HAMP domain-containing sensor histidine kinase [Pseudomonadota bacterium]
MKRLANSLTGRFLGLTILFVMLAEVLIFVPSVARFRLDYLGMKLELSQTASLALLADEDLMVDPELEAELLENAGVLNVVLRRDSMRQLILASPMPAEVEETFDLRDADFVTLVRDALGTFFRSEDRVIRVIGEPVNSGGVMIEVTLYESPLRAALLTYGYNILRLSLIISLVTAALLIIAVRICMVLPIMRVVDQMQAFRDDPEDANRIIRPASGVSEVREAEEALHDLETQLTASLRQKERLAGLGGAVSRISHDLRNMLTTAQLLADRLERSKDPAVARVAPKLVGSLDRAINLCERTLAFGKAEEPAPVLAPVSVARLVRDAMESDRLRTEDDGIRLVCEIPETLEIVADGEQLYRVFANLIRNARQAIVAEGRGGEISVSAEQVVEGCVIRVADSGPGLPQKAVDHLFKPFRGGARRGGTGLGLAIAAELVKGHGGRLDLIETSDAGTVFAIVLPTQTGLTSDSGASNLRLKSVS